MRTILAFLLLWSTAFCADEYFDDSPPSEVWKPKKGVSIENPPLPPIDADITGITEMHFRMFDEHNRIRGLNGVDSLAMDFELCRLAEKQARCLAETGKLGPLPERLAGDPNTKELSYTHQGQRDSFAAFRPLGMLRSSQLVLLSATHTHVGWAAFYDKKRNVTCYVGYFENRPDAERKLMPRGTADDKPRLDPRDPVVKDLLKKLEMVDGAYAPGAKTTASR